MKMLQNASQAVSFQFQTLANNDNDNETFSERNTTFNPL
jgi:hypothetical protein